MRRCSTAPVWTTRDPPSNICRSSTKVVRPYNSSEGIVVPDRYDHFVARWTLMTGTPANLTDLPDVVIVLLDPASCERIADSVVRTCASCTPRAEIRPQAPACAAARRRSTGRATRAVGVRGTLRNWRRSGSRGPPGNRRRILPDSAQNPPTSRRRVSRRSPLLEGQRRTGTRTPLQRAVRADECPLSASQFALPAVRGIESRLQLRIEPPDMHVQIRPGFVLVHMVADLHVREGQRVHGGDRVLYRVGVAGETGDREGQIQRTHRTDDFGRHCHARAATLNPVADHTMCRCAGSTRSTPRWHRGCADERTTTTISVSSMATSLSVGLERYILHLVSTGPRASRRSASCRCRIFC